MTSTLIEVEIHSQQTGHVFRALIKKSDLEKLEIDEEFAIIHDCTIHNTVLSGEILKDVDTVIDPLEDPKPSAMPLAEIKTGQILRCEEDFLVDKESTTKLLTSKILDPINKRLSNGLLATEDLIIMDVNELLLAMANGKLIDHEY